MRRLPAHIGGAGIGWERGGSGFKKFKRFRKFGSNEPQTAKNREPNPEP
jgi:hypothetical protein